MTLVQAQAVATDARTVFDDPAADARIWSELLDALDAASPLIEDAGLGRAFLDMRGIAGDAAARLAAVRASLAQDDASRVAGAARARREPVRRARRGTDRRRHDRAARCGGVSGAHAARAAARVELRGEAVRERLRLLGVTTLGGLAALPHGPFVRRFGPDAARWHDLARGIDDRPLKPRARALRVGRTLYGEGEASSEEQVLFALRTLAGWVADDLCAAGKRAGRLVLHLECEDGETREIATRVAQPTAMPSTLFDLLRARLEGVVLTAAVAGLRLAAEELAGGGVAVSLFAASDPDPDALGVVLARLDAVLGEGRALRARIVDGPRIERRFVLEPFTLHAAARRHPDARPHPEPKPRHPEPKPRHPELVEGRATLQLCLVPPRPVDVRVLDGAPRFVGSPPQAVVEVAGPWRVEESWWARFTGEGERLARDEYDVCLEDGALLRIAREGSAANPGEAVWSIHGIYD